MTDRLGSPGAPRYRLRSGPLRAVIDATGAGLREFSCDGIDLVETWRSGAAPLACGVTLFPWPNRVRGGRWSFDGSDLQLPVNEPERRTAIHGFVAGTVFEEVAFAGDRVRLRTRVRSRSGYPFDMECTVQYRLSERGLTVDYLVRNRGERRAPFGVGAHPYLRVGATPAPELRLHVPAATRTRDDDQLIPIALEPVAGTSDDFRTARILGAFTGNVSYTDLRPQQDSFVSGQAPADRWEATLTAADGHGVALWAERCFSWAQLFVTSAFPGQSSSAARTAVAIEPMTCAVDAFNSGRSLLMLDPGAGWRGAWGLRPVRPAIGRIDADLAASSSSTWSPRNSPR